MGFTETVKSSIGILFFEMFGTALLTYIEVTTGELNKVPAGFILGVWITILFGFRISGSHYNPAVTLACMLRKDTGTFSRPMGFAYILF